MELSELNRYIPLRKSVRDFTQSPLEERVLDQLVDFLSEQRMPKDGIDWNFDTLPRSDMLELAGKKPRVAAPHYLVLRSQRKQFALQNCGYLGELAALWLCAKGIGSCWQGGVVVFEDFPGLLPYMAAIAFGPAHDPHRDNVGEVDRKPLKSIAGGDDLQSKLKIAEAFRLAPSNRNKQPARVWFQKDKAYVYRRQGIFRNPFALYKEYLDIGAALAHLHVAFAAQGYTVSFERAKGAPSLPRREYQITASLAREE